MKHTANYDKSETWQIMPPSPHLVDGDSVDIGVVHKPDDLVWEELSVVLGGQVRLSGLRGVELQTLADALSQYVQGRVGLHDLSHGLLNQGLASREPVTIAAGEREDNVLLHIQN